MAAVTKKPAMPTSDSHASRCRRWAPTCEMWPPRKEPRLKLRRKVEIKSAQT
jgi:hypothetical protein